MAAQVPPVEQIPLLLEKVLGFDAGGLTRPELKTLGFPEFRETFEASLAQCNLVKGLRLDGVPRGNLNSARDALSQLATALATVGDWDPSETPSVPAQQSRQNLLGTIERATTNLFGNLFPLIIVGTRHAVMGADLEKLREEAEHLVAQAHSRVTTLLVEAETALAAIRAAAGNAGVDAQASHFGEAKAQHRHSSWIWLGVASVFGAGTALYAWAVASGWLPGGDPTDAATIARYVMSRGVFLTLLLYGLSWAGRNFKAAKHNEVVNGHRATALRTFRAFVEATDDAQIRNAVLLQATQSIFAAQASGFLGSEPEPLPQSTIIEVLRKVGTDGAKP